MSPRVLLCPGHGVREPGRTWDPGAVYLDIEEREVCGDVAEQARVLLEARGIGAEVYDGPGYEREHVHAVARLDGQSERALYVSLHCNAGGGRYTMAMHDHRSAAGRRAATAIVGELGALPEMSAAKIEPLSPGVRGWVCIDGMWRSRRACGVLVELGFIDAPEHAPLWTDEGRARLAAALAEGIARYLLP